MINAPYIVVEVRKTAGGLFRTFAGAFSVEAEAEIAAGAFARNSGADGVRRWYAVLTLAEAQQTHIK